MFLCSASLGEICALILMPLFLPAVLHRSWRVSKSTVFVVCVCHELQPLRMSSWIRLCGSALHKSSCLILLQLSSSLWWSTFDILAWVFFMPRRAELSAAFRFFSCGITSSCTQMGPFTIRLPSILAVAGSFTDYKLCIKWREASVCVMWAILFVETFE